MRFGRENWRCLHNAGSAIFLFVAWLLVSSSVLVADSANDLQRRQIGLFDARVDIGAVKHAGSSSYDRDTQSYRLSGSGTNMWESSDEFHFVWRKINGDFILSTNAAFLGEGVDPHRKLGWMVRAELSNDSAYVDIALHGDGLTSMQFRRSDGAITQQIESAVAAPDSLQLERRNGQFIMSVAEQGDTFSVDKLDGIELPDEVYVGLFICSHNADVVEEGRFWNTRITVPAPADFRPYQDYYGSRLEVLDVDSGHRRVLHTEVDSLQAPNWSVDGQSLIYNRNGRLYRYELATGEIADIDTDFAVRNNNDHALSFDGAQLAISHHSDEHDGNSMIYTLPAIGGTPKLITDKGPSYFHGWSPDGKWLVYTGGRDGRWDIYKIRSDGSEPEIRLTEHEALDDGSEFSPDGKFIYFNSSRSGRMQIWRMKADGSDEQQVSDDEFNNWFPHISPDGKQMVYLAYGSDVDADDHPWYRHVYLMLKPVAGGEAKVLASLYGGQGTINVPSWSPDSKQIAFVSNSVLEFEQPGQD